MRWPHLHPTTTMARVLPTASRRLRGAWRRDGLVASPMKTPRGRLFRPKWRARLRRGYVLSSRGLPSTKVVRESSRGTRTVPSNTFVLTDGTQMGRQTDHRCLRRPRSKTASFGQFPGTRQRSAASNFDLAEKAGFDAPTPFSAEGHDAGCADPLAMHGRRSTAPGDYAEQCDGPWPNAPGEQDPSGSAGAPSQLIPAGEDIDYVGATAGPNSSAAV